MAKEKIDIIRRKTGLFLMRATFVVLKIFPLFVVLPLGRSMGFLWYHLPLRHRKRAIESLKCAYENRKSDKEINNIALDGFRFMGEFVCEIFYFLEFRRRH